MSFTHLNQHQRYQIEVRLAQGQSLSVIARAIGIHRSTVYREHARGLVGGRYCAHTAHGRALKRRAISAANHPCKPPALWRLVGHCLRQDWSPEQINGRLRLIGRESVSHQGIYDWLRRQPGSLASHLRHYREYCPWGKGHAGLPKGRPSIRRRPKSVAKRKQCGHWEGDTIRGKSAHQCLLTLVERKSLYTRISNTVPKQADCIAQAVRHALAKLPAKTLTVDNGSEFAAYASMGLPVYFADPGRPRQRARNENTNGLIRQYVPKKARLAGLSRYKIKRIEHRLNHRPRKSLGYKTPHEVLFNLKPAPVAIRT